MTKTFLQKTIACLTSTVLIFTLIPLTKAETPSLPDASALFESLNQTKSSPLDFIPKNYLGLFELNLEDDGQREAFMNFLTKIKKSATTDQNELKYWDTIVNNLLYKNHIWLGLDNQKITNEKDFPKLIIGAFINDHGQMELLINLFKDEKLIVTEEVSKNNLPYYKISQTATDKYPLYFTSLNQVGLLSGNLNTLEKMADLKNHPASALNSDLQWKDGQSKLPNPHLLAGYVNLAAVYELIKQTDKNSELPSDLYQAYSFIKNTSLALKIESDNLKIGSYTIGNESVMDANNFHFSDFIVKNSLYPKFPKNTPLLASESANLKKIIELEIKIIQDSLKNQGEKASQLNINEEFTKLTGLNLAEDILSWLGQEIAFSMQNTGQLIPGLTTLINAAGNPTKAKSFALYLNQKITDALKSNEEAAKYISQKSINGSDSLFAINIDVAQIIIDNLGDEIDNPDALKTTLPPLKITYGLTTDNIMLFSTFPEVTNHLNEGLENDPDFAAATKKLPLDNGGSGYFSVHALLVYIESTLASLTKITGQSPDAEFYQGYYGLQEFLYGLNYLISSQHNEIYTSSATNVIQFADGKSTTNFLDFINQLKTADSDQDGADDYTEAFLYKTNPYQIDSVSKTNFNDIAENAWYSTAVGSLANKKVIRGYSDGDKTVYRPEQAITRGEFTKMVVEAFHVPFANPTSFDFDTDLPVKESYPGHTVFSDVKYSDWQFRYIYAAENAGIAKGYLDKTFRPNEPITRAEALVMLLGASGDYTKSVDYGVYNLQQAKFRGLEKWEKAPFVDIESHWIRGQVNYAYTYKIIKGIDATHFAPNRAINRAEGAVMIYNMQKFSLEQLEKKPSLSTFTQKAVEGVKELNK